MVTASVFSLLLAILGVLFLKSLELWRGSSAGSDVQTEFLKARPLLQSDLVLTSPTLWQRSEVPSSLGGGKDGQAVWFLSPVDPSSSKVITRTSDGSPVWQRTVLYYLTVPTDHNSLFGSTCAGGSGPNGFNQTCPHKVLIKKVIDTGTKTLPDDSSTEETLPSNMESYLTRPVGYDVSGLKESGVEEVKLVAKNLLSFLVQPGVEPSEIEVVLSAVPLEQIRREVALGTTLLHENRLLQESRFSVFPKN